MKSLWTGPQRDGITYSMLSYFMCCPHRFWIKNVLGLDTIEEFNHAIEYGNFWHNAEEAYGNKQDWKKVVKKYAQRLRSLYPSSEKEIDKWAAICIMQFDMFIKLGLGKLKASRKYLACEHAFKVKYEFDGRYVWLRGKIDRIFQLKGDWIEEHKTKGRVDEQGIQGTLHHNCQTMMYNIASRLLDTDPNCPKHLRGLKPKGTYYNVIRRPLGDHYSIRQRKSETQAQFIRRLGEQIKAKKKYYFMEYPTIITTKDIEVFKQQCLNPMLHRLCDWWNSIKKHPHDPWKSPLHFRFPYGIYNGLTGGFRGDYYDLITKGSKRNLRQLEALFPELQDG